MRSQRYVNEARLRINDLSNLKKLFGGFDANVALIEEVFDVEISVAEDSIVIKGKQNGSSAQLALKFLEELIQLFQEGLEVEYQDLQKMALAFKADRNAWWKNEAGETILVTAYNKPIRPKTPGQVKYVQAVRKAEITFCIGPAGTGKTYLAMAMACAALQRKEVSRIVLVRPAVEAGESLGFLPGDLKEKIEPYLRPLYDALYEMLSPERFQKFSDRGTIEVAPLAYMRGRTLNDSFIVLDEAQNTTAEQMKMFLTRMGFGSKVVVTGDITQIDLPAGKTSGLVLVQHILKDIEGIEFIYLSERDVVRHHLVQKIILAYEQFEKKASSKK
ncbi:MAG: phosphate starvation-inducible protein PhoH [Candidatus Atribacteria bacterium]|nr:phosphate starvation-inducible protein PhoH [Candidatus Atribacteria bacterium]MDI3530866.1 phosphate starvation-inducible protein PhoH [Candidatus Atribacteria bacterium]